MNYYIQGSPARAEEIKATFEKLGYSTSLHTFFDEDTVFITLNGNICECNYGDAINELIKTHPDYKELELPVEHKFKFKVGDWIVRGEGFVYEPSLITEIRDYYICELLNGERVTYTLNDVHKNFHLWTLAGAKDGDVLAVDWHQDDDSWEKIVIFKKYHAKGVKGLFNSPCVEGYGNTFKNGKLVLQEEVPYYSKTWTMTLQPATREQRDLLFAKMREAGHEWDADKKELRKIQPHYDIANFHEGMPVLVRDDNGDEWNYLLFSHYRKKLSDHFFAGGSPWFQCIPFNGDTKHLLGTTDMPSEEFINW